MILHNIVEFYTQWFRVCLDITTVSLPYLKPLSNNTTIQIKLVRMSTIFHSTKLHLSQGNSSLVVSIIKLIKFKFHRLFTFVFMVISKQILIKSCPYCDMLGFRSNATVEWCVIVVFPHRCNNENKCLLTMKTKR
jgi:hypothetical protein